MQYSVFRREITVPDNGSGFWVWIRLHKIDCLFLLDFIRRGPAKHFYFSHHTTEQAANFSIFLKKGIRLLLRNI